MGGGGETEVKTRVAQYLEDAHQWLIWAMQNEIDDDLTLSPYGSHTYADLDGAFFGLGFVLSSFPSLYDIYGKFMAGLDVDSLYNQIFIDTTTGPLITTLVSEQAVELADDRDINVLPRYETGMRDLNAVMSSSFIVGRSNIEAARIKSLSKFDAELRYKLIPVASERWGKHLDWNKNVVEMYANILKLYLAAKIDTDNAYYELETKHRLWDYTILDNFRLVIGALTAGTRTSTDALGGGASQGQKALGGAMTGAAIGSEINMGYGTAIGAVVGAAAGYFM